MSDIISQLAKEMNLSQRTIYRALHNPTATTRAALARRAEEICSRAAMLGYRTNVAARSIRNGNFKQMLFVTARFDQSPVATLSSYITVLAELLLQRGCRLLLEELLIDRRTGMMVKPRKLFSEHCSDGIFAVVSAGHFPSEMETALTELGLPLVWLNHCPSTPGSGVVISDESDAITEMCRHLAAVGHRKIAFLTLEYAHYSAAHRKREMERAAKETGLELVVLHTNESQETSCCRRTANHFLDNYFPEYTAAVCYNREFMEVFRLEAGKRGIAIPGQLSVCHFISISERQVITEFPQTGVRIPEAEMAHEALKRMDLLTAGLPAGASTISVPASFTIGESTASPDRTGQ